MFNNIPVQGGTEITVKHMLKCFAVLGSSRYNHISSSFPLVLILMIGSEMWKHGSKIACDQEKEEVMEKRDGETQGKVK